MISDKSGEGSTTIAIGLSIFLSSVRGERTAVVMTGERSGYKTIVENYSENLTGSCVSVCDVDFFFAENEKEILSICMDKYENIILDIGKYFAEYTGIIFRSDLKIILQSVNIWRNSDGKALNPYGGISGNRSGWLYILGGSTKEVKIFCKRNDITGIKKIKIDNPFEVNDENLVFYEKIL